MLSACNGALADAPAGTLSRERIELDLAKAALKARAQRLDAMHYAMDCASGASPARLRSINEQAPSSIAGRAASFPFPEICEAWGIRPLPQGFRSSFKSEVPVLLFSGTLDARTPVSNAEEMLESFPRGHHVIVAGAGHDWCRHSACLDIVAEFLTERTVELPRVTVLSPIPSQRPWASPR